MKKILLILISIFCLQGFSQTSMLITNVTTSANVTANSIVLAATSVNTTTTLDFDIKNNTGSTKSYIVKRYDVVLHTASSVVATAYFCFAGTCYASTTQTSAAITLTASQSASQFTTTAQMLTTDLDEVGTVGYSLVKYTFINTANTSDSLQFSIKYNAALGLSEMAANSLSSFELFPNPATDVTVLKVNSQKTMDAKVIIYNALGAIVSEKPVGILEGKNKIELNVSDLSSGVYLAQIKMGSGSVTKKLVVK
ncbi:MAG: T9SS type A sorting domain-containing protein [Bacteroidota bacterium]